MAAGRRKRGKGGGGHAGPDERWLLTYADMITLLMALFMVLFSISSVNTSKFESLQRALQDAFSGRILPGGEAIMEAGAGSEAQRNAPEPPLPAMLPLDSLSQVSPAQTEQQNTEAAQKEDEDFRRLKQRIDQLAARAGLKGRVTTQVRRRGLVVRLVTDDVFFDSGSATLQPRSLELLTRIGRLIREERRHPVVVEGYTDSRPIASASFPSNWELSGARAAAVVRHFNAAGVESQRMSVAGYAQHHPIDTNSTPEGRARNRPVEVVLARLQKD